MAAEAGRESCGCLERIAEAAEKRRQAAEAEERAVEELHAAIIDGYDAPTCSHSWLDLGKASGLSKGGIHNVIVGSGRVRDAG